MDISIIGGGPAGCYAAYLLAKSGHNVNVYEEHAEIGSPVQCTGLLSSDFDTLDLPKHGNFIINKFENIVVNSPKKSVKLKQTEYLVDRTKFDIYLANLAEGAGAKINLSHSFMGKDNGTLILKDKMSREEKKVVPDMIIAADGPLSKVAQNHQIFHPERKNYLGMQAVVRGNFDFTGYQTFFGKEVCPDFFAWIVPESESIARVGVASKGKTRQYFDNFIAKHNFDVIEIQAGTIPIHHPRQKVQSSNCYLLGDAAGHVKATTLGGIIPGLRAADVLVDCINNNKSYEKELSKLKKELWLHLQARLIFDRFKDKDWDKLLHLVSQERVQRVLGKYSRDNPVPLFFNLILKEPRFLLFGRRLLW
jgi:digeranylgeranylglycerophospholipid reductase